MPPSLSSYTPPTPPRSAAEGTPSAASVGKPFWQSKTVIGAVVAMVSLVIGLHGGKVDSAALTDDITSALGILGTILALYGRIKAEQPIVWKK